MISIRRSADRGHFDHGWLDTYHTFSFGQYWDPNHMGFRALRVINEDTVAPAQGFDTHPHHDMEILTLVLQGTLRHRDSMGHSADIPAGQMQAISAGTGITHSEFNPSDRHPVHLYQIWIFPSRRGLKPTYQQLSLPDNPAPLGLRLVASPHPSDSSLTLNQDASVYIGRIDPPTPLNHQLAPGRFAWLQILHGNATLNGQQITAGDGAAVSDEHQLTLESAQPTQILLFDLA